MRPGVSAPEEPRHWAGVRVLVLSDRDAEPWAHALQGLGLPVHGRRWPGGEQAQGERWREWVKALPAAEVVLACRPPCAAGDERWTLLQAAVPCRVFIACSGFGLSGPRSGHAASDLVASAAGGQLGLCGHPGAPPRRAGWRLTDHAVALQAALAAAVGLLRHARSGAVTRVDLSAQEVVASMLDHALPGYLFEGRVAHRGGDVSHRHTTFTSPCADGFIQLNIATQWDLLVAWMDGDGLAADLGAAVWTDPSHRSEHFEHLRAVIARWTRTHTVDELFHTAQALRFPWAPVRQPAALAGCPQLRARQARPAPSAADTLAEPTEPLRSSRVRPGDPPLKGLRVLDFTWVLAGPYATRLFADLGAEVIKVQSRRTLGSADANRDPYFELWNRNKHSLTLDMDTPEARQIVWDLVGQVDVVIDNFSPRVMRHWGLTPERLHSVNPRLVIASLSAFGQTGPWSDYVAFGPALQAAAGLLCQPSHPADPPTGLGYAHADHVIGLQAALRVMAALAAREDTGQGQRIDLSGFEAIADARHMAVGEGDAFLEGCYPCAGHDRWCAISLAEPGQWARLCELAPGHDWPEASAGASERQHLHLHLHEALAAWSATQPAEALALALQRAGIAAAVVASVHDLFHDPHLRARGFFVPVEHPLHGWVHMDRPPIASGNLPLVDFAPAPELGADNEAVLSRHLGLNATQIDGLTLAGALR